MAVAAAEVEVAAADVVATAESDLRIRISDMFNTLTLEGTYAEA